jgi:transcriptional regulator with XRE-family HTH domain
MPKSAAEWCAAQGITFEVLVERTGLDDGRVRAILLGRWTPSPAERQAVASALGVSKDDVTWGHVTPIQHLYGHGPG